MDFNTLGNGHAVYLHVVERVRWHFYGEEGGFFNVRQTFFCHVDVHHHIVRAPRFIALLD